MSTYIVMVVNNLLKVKGPMGSICTINISKYYCVL